MSGRSWGGAEIIIMGRGGDDGQLVQVFPDFNVVMINVDTENNAIFFNWISISYVLNTPAPSHVYKLTLTSYSENTRSTQHI